jgi:hypothetical protein
MNAEQAALALVESLLAERSRPAGLAREAAALADELERLTEPGSGSPRTAGHVAAALLCLTAARLAEELAADAEGRDVSVKRMIAIDSAAAETRRIADSLELVRIDY